MSVDERKSRHSKRRQALTIKQVDARLRALSVEDVGQMLAAKVGSSNESGTLEVTSLLLAFGTSGRADRGYPEDPWDRYDRLRTEKDETRAAAGVHEVVQTWVRRLTMHDSSRVEFQALEARRMCEILGIDYAAIEADAVQALPQPKSWGLPPEEETPRPPEPSGSVSETAPEPASEDTAGRRDESTRPARREKRSHRRDKSRRRHGKRVRAA